MDKDTIHSVSEEVTVHGYSAFNDVMLPNNNNNRIYKKVEFNLSTRQNINITPYWFLGFAEGHGSFNISTRGSNLIFSIGQSNR